jgi:hypothetical protein
LICLSASAILSLQLPAASAAGDYAGARACAACHPAQAGRQNSSPHAGALFRAADHPLAGSFAGGTLLRPPAWRFEFLKTNGALQTRISDGRISDARGASDSPVMELPMDWAFGDGRQAVTFVTRVDAQWYVEHFASWYPALRAWGPTPGQDSIRPATLARAAGVLYPAADPAAGIAGCFECHSTGPVSFDANGDVELGEPGVHCEACHGAGAAHVKKPARSNIESPAKFTAGQMNQFCGRCHRAPPPPGATTDFAYSWNVRHQPVYLSQSACFLRSAGKLSCLTCHDPHEATEKKPAAFYNGVCMNCHSRPALSPKAICLEQQPANCIDCHMPMVSPQPPLRFTNHWIGVYGEGAKLKPLR